jgi:hypothetical protein
MTHKHAHVEFADPESSYSSTPSPSISFEDFRQSQSSGKQVLLLDGLLAPPLLPLLLHLLLLLFSLPSSLPSTRFDPHPVQDSLFKTEGQADEVG